MFVFLFPRHLIKRYTGKGIRKGRTYTRPLQLREKELVGLFFNPVFVHDAVRNRIAVPLTKL